MRDLRFSAVGFTDREVRRWVRSRPGSGRLLTGIACAAAVVYAINHPGRIRITEPVSWTSAPTRQIVVQGTVQNPRMREVTLAVNDEGRTVPVDENGVFETVAHLDVGVNRIQASVGGAAEHVMPKSNIVLVGGPTFDAFGNPIGAAYGLARDDEFGGNRLLLWADNDEVKEQVFNKDNPLWEALRRKGFELEFRTGQFQPDWLEHADQLWMFSGNVLKLDQSAYPAVVRFVESGKGLYLLADNQPYLQEAAFLAMRLFSAEIAGFYDGRGFIGVRRPGMSDLGLEADRRPGIYVPDHPLLTDINIVFEGVTVSHITGGDGLHTVLHATDGKPLVAVSLDPNRRVVIDCAFTRYYYAEGRRWVTETPGTMRFAENVAAYLAGKDHKGHERTSRRAREWEAR